MSSLALSDRPRSGYLTQTRSNRASSREFESVFKNKIVCLIGSWGVCLQPVIKRKQKEKGEVREELPVSPLFSFLSLSLVPTKINR